MRRAALAALSLAGLAADPGATQDVSTLTATVSQSFEVDTNFELDDPSPGTSTFADTRLDDGARPGAGRRASSGSASTPACARSGKPSRTSSSSSPRRASPFSPSSTPVPTPRSTPTCGSQTREVDSTEGFVDDGRRCRTTRRDRGRMATRSATTPTSASRSSPRRRRATAVRFIGSSIDYSNEDETTGAPQQVAEGQAFWRLRLNPVLSSELLGSYLFYEADDAVDTEIRIAQVDFRADLRAQREPDPRRRPRLRRPRARGVRAASG